MEAGGGREREGTRVPAHKRRRAGGQGLMGKPIWPPRGRGFGQKGPQSLPMGAACRLLQPHGWGTIRPERSLFCIQPLCAGVLSTWSLIRCHVDLGLPVVVILCDIQGVRAVYPWSTLHIHQHSSLAIMQCQLVGNVLLHVKSPPKMAALANRSNCIIIREGLHLHHALFGRYASCDNAITHKSVKTIRSGMWDNDNCVFSIPKADLNFEKIITTRYRPTVPNAKKRLLTDAPLHVAENW